MKNCIIFAVVIGLMFCGASPLWAGGLINKNNLSAEYIRTLNRAAATDAADIVAYNPAGTLALDDGLYTNLSAQYFDKDYENVTGGTAYNSNEPSTIPAFYAVYKKDKWAGFFGFNIPIGGGKVEYPNGNATTVKIKNTYGGSGSMKLEADSWAYGYTFGGAYQINDMFAVSLAARYIDSKKWVSGHAPAAALGGTAYVEYETKATGWGGIIGLDMFVSKALTIAFKYETKTNLNYTYTHLGGTNAQGTMVLNQFGYPNGGEAHEDLPAVFSLGLSYNFTPKLRFEPTLTYYFNKDADIGGIGNNSKTLEDRIGNGYDVGFAFEYAFTEGLKTSLGILWTDTGCDPDDMLPESPELNAFSMSVGIAWQAKPNLEFNVGIGRVFYHSETTSSGAFFPNTEYSKDITQMAFGVQYKFF